MRAELKRLHSPDTDELEKYLPADTTSFCILVQAMIGPAGEDGDESFDIVVCNPGWIAQRVNECPIFFPRHHLVVARFDYRAIESYISEFCASCEGADWDEVGLKVSRLGRWEFEDYSE